jgi:hypothetical protein
MPRPLRVLLLLLLVACSAAPAPLRQAPPTRSLSAASSSSIIYVIKRRWHVDIGFASADLQPPLASLRSDFPAARYVLFGFGDRHYLLNQDRGFGGMLAALWPGAGLMLVTGLTATAQAAFGDDNVIEIAVDAAQARDAQAFVWRSLAAENASIKPLRVGPYDGSLYYAASQRYSALHTCNTWAAEALRAANLPVHSTGVAFSGQLWRQLRALDQERRADSTGAP